MGWPKAPPGRLEGGPNVAANAFRAPHGTHLRIASGCGDGAVGGSASLAGRRDHQSDLLRWLSSYPEPLRDPIACRRCSDWRHGSLSVLLLRCTGALWAGAGTARGRAGVVAQPCRVAAARPERRGSAAAAASPPQTVPPDAPMNLKWVQPTRLAVELQATLASRAALSARR